MCDQTEVVYSPGDVVWVKLGPVWWPGQVFDYDKLPEEITANLRKKPIAVVKFFQEDSYEYVKNLNSIYHYNCRRKHEFIRKGLDMCRSNSRDIPSNMKMFPNDIATAEHITNGDPNILSSREFAPEEKEDYSELFGKKTPKKGKTENIKKDNHSWRLKGGCEYSSKAGRRSLPTPAIPRPITHPRFITKALKGQSDHEVRIRQQVLPSGSRNSGGIEMKQYNCHLCGFSSSRINVIVLHNKSHSAGYADAYLPPQQQTSKSRKIKNERKLVYSSEKRPRVSDIFKSDEPPAKKKSVKINEGSDLTHSVISVKKQMDIPGKSTSLKKPVFGRKKSAKDKAEKLAKEKQQNDAFRETLLKDWDEDEDNEDDNIDSSKDIDSNREIDNSMDSSINSSEKNEGNSSKQKEMSCFDFDDSEDGLNIGETVMKFGQKIPRVLDKPKKQTKDLLEESSSTVDESNNSKIEESNNELALIKNDNSGSDMHDSTEKSGCEESQEKENEDFQSAFKNLLDETAVPVIPDAPSHFELKKSSDEETSSFHQRLQDDGGGGSRDAVCDNENVGGICNEEKSEGSGSIIFAADKEINEGISDTVSEPIIIKKESNDGVQNVSDGDEKKEISFVDTEHFLVKTSEEVATSSSDDPRLEVNISPNENNVATSAYGAEIIDSGEAKNDCSVSNEKSSEETSIKDQNDRKILENIQTISSLSNDFHDNVVKGSEDISSLYLVKESDQGKLDINKTNTAESSTNSQDLKTGQFSNSSARRNKSSVPEKNSFQEMDFDINSMPVIISEDMVHSQENNIATTSVNKSDSFLTSKVSTITSDVCSSGDSKLIMVKNVSKPAVIDSTSNSKLSAILNEEVSSGSLTSLHGKDKLSTRKVLLSPTKTVAASRSPQVATIKVQPSSSVATKLTVPGGIISQKNMGSTSQVLILKSTAPVQSGKSTLQKISNTSQMIQQGGKVLILTNPQGAAGQSKVLSSLTTSQQKTLSPSKLTGTRILTTKGTVLTTGSPGAMSKANILSGSSKTVTTKSGQKILINKGGIISHSPKSVIINKSGVLTTVNSPTVVSSKSSRITQNILSGKSDLAANSQLNSSQMTVSCKGATATILTSPGFTTNKSMILTPVTSNKGASLANNQKLRLITTSKASSVSAPTSSGTKLMIQSSPSRMILPSSSLTKNQQLKLIGNIKGQSSTSTILIQTSQGVIATTPLTSSQVGNKTKLTKSSLPTVMSTALSPTKTATIQVAQALPQSQNKLIVQKVKPAGPNILQKSQRKPIQRNNKRAVSNQLITSAVSVAQNIQTARTPVTVNALSSAAQDTLILSTSSGLPVIGQSNVVQGNQLDPSNQTALVYLTVDESGNYRPLESTPVVNYEGATGDSQTLYIDPGTTDLDNIFLAIDDSGNVVNISQPVQNTYTTESSTTPPSQDILAKALANTQVLQQETIASESIPLTSSVESSILSGCMFVEPQTQYHQPSLSHSVLETSLTLNQPIMTPLEVPSAVSPRSLDQISTLPTGFLSDSLLTTSCDKEKKSNVHPSMPLLSEESDCSTTGGSESKNETVFYTQVGVDGSHAVLTPVTSGSQLAFQLALDENNVIVSSTPRGITSLGVISNSSMHSQSSLTYIPHSELPVVSEIDSKKSININNSSSPSVFTSVSQGNNVENYQLTDKLLEKTTISNDKVSSRNISEENLVLGLSEDSVTSALTFKMKDEDQKMKNENGNTNQINSEVNATEATKAETVEEHNELLMTDHVGRTENSDVSVANVITEAKTECNFSEVSEAHMEINDQNDLILNTLVDSSAENEQAVSKVNIVATVEGENYFDADNVIKAESSVTNGNSDAALTGKRHLEDISSSDYLNSDIESKKIKLDER